MLDRNVFAGSPRMSSCLLAAAITGLTTLAHGQGFPAVVQLSELDGSDGFLIRGVAAGDEAGFSVSQAGDINGDGADDLIIGARFAFANDDLDAGASYVLFGGGKVGSSGKVELSDIDGSNGFVINGVGESSFLGASVSTAGDINDDGVTDLIIGAPFADVPGVTDQGLSYVVFGGNSTISGGSLNVAELDGVNGFAVSIITGGALGDSVSAAGDFNGDGSRRHHNRSLTGQG